MKLGIALPILTLVLATGCPGDDTGGADAETSTSTMSSTASSTMTTMPMTDSEPPTSTSTPDTGSDSMGETSSTTAYETTTSTTTGGDDLVWLQNDGYEPTENNLTWQIWAGVGDCWAATYQIDNGLYPFDIVAAQVAIGGADGTETFEVGIWNVAGNNQPQDSMATMDVDHEGNVGLTPAIDLTGLGVTIDSGNFAFVMCHTGHMGSPSIGTDIGADFATNRNWVNTVGTGEWVQSQDFAGIDGNFVMRLGVRPQG